MKIETEIWSDESFFSYFSDSNALRFYNSILMPLNNPLANCCFIRVQEDTLKIIADSSLPHLCHRQTAKSLILRVLKSSNIGCPAICTSLAKEFGIDDLESIVLFQMCPASDCEIADPPALDRLILSCKTHEKIKDVALIDSLDKRQVFQGEKFFYRSVEMQIVDCFPTTFGIFSTLTTHIIVSPSSTVSITDEKICKAFPKLSAPVPSLSCRIYILDEAENFENLQVFLSLDALMKLGIPSGSFVSVQSSSGIRRVVTAQAIDGFEECSIILSPSLFYMLQVSICDLHCQVASFESSKLGNESLAEFQVQRILTNDMFRLIEISKNLDISVDDLYNEIAQALKKRLEEGWSQIYNNQLFTVKFSKNGLVETFNLVYRIVCKESEYTFKIDLKSVKITTSSDQISDSVIIPERIPAKILIRTAFAKTLVELSNLILFHEHVKPNGCLSVLIYNSEVSHLFNPLRYFSSRLGYGFVSISCLKADFEVVFSHLQSIVLSRGTAKTIIYFTNLDFLNVADYGENSAHMKFKLKKRVTSYLKSLKNNFVIVVTCKTFDPELSSFFQHEIHLPKLNSQQIMEFLHTEGIKYSKLFSSSDYVEKIETLNHFEQISTLPLIISAKKPFGNEDFVPSDIPVSVNENKKFSILKQSKIRFDDISGLQHAKKELKLSIVLPLKQPEMFTSQPRTGLLFYGPPGCGKTMLAKAVAGEMGNCHFMSVKGPELMNKYIGETEKSVREVFSIAKSYSRCVIFFDELDALLGESRGGGDASRVMSRVIGQFGVEMDLLSSFGTVKNEEDFENGNIEKKPFVLVISATNRPDMLDSALLRPGRFDKSIYVGPPETTKEIESFLKLIIQKSPNLSLELSEEENIRRLAEKIPLGRWTGADFYGVSVKVFQSALERFALNNQDKDEKRFNELQIEFEDWNAAISNWIPSLTESELFSYAKPKSKT